MSSNWSEHDQKRWSRLSKKGYNGRNVDEEMEFEALDAKREIARLKQEDRVRKSGALHKPAIVCFLLGLGSCGAAFATEEWGLIGVGVGLAFFSSLLNWLNGKLTGTD